MKHYRAYIELSQKYGFVACTWDDGGDFRIMERAARKWDEVKDILISTSSAAPRISLKVIQDTLIQVGWSNALSADSIFIEYRTASGSYRKMISLPSDSVKWFHTGASEETWHYYRIIAQYSGTEKKFSEPQRIYLPKYVLKVRGLYKGSPLAIPGTIEAEDFDTGGEGLTWHEASITNLGGAYRPTESVDIFNGNNGEYYISNVWPGEWFEHTVNVQTEGEYIIRFHVAAKEAGGTFILKIGNSFTDTLSVPSTQSSIITTVISDTVFLSQGEQIMRFSVVDIPYFSIDKFEFLLVPVITSVHELSTALLHVNLHNDFLTITLTGSEMITELLIYDADGRLILSNHDPGLTIIVPAGKLSEGLHIIRAVTNIGLLSRKIIISR